VLLFQLNPQSYIPFFFRSAMRRNLNVSKQGALRAFTLIELLVVIAIIAILAAILFPVFAQAKMAAKASASISNIQQLGTAVQLYVTDYDDTVPLTGEWNTGHDVGSPGGSDTVSTWSWNLLPYMKNSAVTQDPLALDNGIVLAGGTRLASDLFFPQYGFNYVYLTPYDQNAMVQHPVTMTTPAQPANTVLLASKYSYTETNIAFNGFTEFDVTGSPALWSTVEVPDCFTAALDPTKDCVANWGANDGYINDSTVVGVSRPEAGSNTGGVSFRSNGKAIVVFLDTHAKKMGPGDMAAGTNWTPTMDSNMVTTTDPSKYIWDLN
jgi:prepilin-type N-terminal cleavage/methylation domain-containing protein